MEDRTGEDRTGLATKGQWDTPLVGRVRDGLAAHARAEAIRTASAADLQELGTRLSFAEILRRNGDRYASHVASVPTLKPIHINGLASIRNQAEDAEAEVFNWWTERAPEPDPVTVADLAARLVDSGLFEPPADLPEVEGPCDGLAIAAGYRFLGDTRGTKRPDTSRGTPHAIFLRESDLTLWVRVRALRFAGELQGYSGPPVAEVLGTRAKV
jgi:hypothetical protein